MNEQRFTPGPWDYMHRLVKGGMHQTQVFCTKGETIASFAWYPMPTVNGVTGTYREGNASLCAAAPEMLEALQMLVGDGEMGAGLTFSERIRNARAAIARALPQGAPHEA